MTFGSNMAQIASLVGDPSRSLMLCVLMDGSARTATELAHAGGVTKQTGSSHLKQMLEGGLLAVETQGRHRYYRLANAEIAHLLETLISVAGATGSKLVPPGPKDERLRKARICYDHLAGDMGVQMLDALLKNEMLSLNASSTSDTVLKLSSKGEAFFSEFGLDVASLKAAKRPICRSCLDWSVRRPHLAGGLGAAILTQFKHLDWVRQSKTPRLLLFTPKGELEFGRQFK